MGTSRIFADRFIDLELVAADGQAEIYKAKHLWLDLPVILKIVRHPDAKARDHLCIEGQAAMRLNHPHVVRAYDFGLTPDCVAFLSLERLEGETLADRIDLRGPLSLTKALEVTIAVARALCAAHAQKIWHLDVKPSNIFLTKDDSVKLLDFGCAEIDGAASIHDADKERKARGTLAYMCPHYASTGRASASADIYSLASTLHEALIGEHPLVGNPRFRISESSLELREIASSALPRPIQEIAPEMPAGLSLELARAMSRTPDDRHESMEVFLRALEVEYAKLIRMAAVRIKSGELGDDNPTTACGMPALLKLVDTMVVSRDILMALWSQSDEEASPSTTIPSPLLQSHPALPSTPRLPPEAPGPAACRGPRDPDATHYGIPARTRADWLLEAIGADHPAFLTRAERRRRALQLVIEPAGEELSPEMLRDMQRAMGDKVREGAFFDMRKQPRIYSLLAQAARRLGLMVIAGLAIATASLRLPTNRQRSAAQPAHSDFSNHAGSSLPYPAEPEPKRHYAALGIQPSAVSPGALSDCTKNPRSSADS